MSAELSKMITDLQKQGAAVVHSGRTNAPQVGEVLGNRWERIQAENPPAAGERLPKPDFQGVVYSLIGLVEHDLGTLVETDESHVSELTTGFEERQDRDQAIGEVTTVLSGIYTSVEAIHGEKAVRKLFGGVSQLPTDAQPLLRLGSRVQKGLREGDVDLSEVQLKGWDAPDREKLAAALQEPLNRLGWSLSGVHSERAETDKSLVEKTRRFEGCRQTVRDAAGCLGALYRLAGLDELADKILPKRRAPRRRGAPEVEGTSASPAEAESPDAGTPAEPAPDGRTPEEAAPDQGTVEARTPAGLTAADNGERNGPIGIVG